MDLTMMDRVGDRWGKREGYCSTGQSPQWAVVPVEEEVCVCVCVCVFVRAHTPLCPCYEAGNDVCQRISFL
jgi:hypothetical protein